MNVLIAGSGQGSWKVRGQQLGDAIGARVVSKLREADLVWADVVVAVKRAIHDVGKSVQRARRVLVWDALDFWMQPEQNGFSEDQSIALARLYIGAYRPALTIAATEAMAQAIGGMSLPHHVRPSLKPRPMNEDVRLVAYEGTPKYLGLWKGELERACERRGWAFVINPPDLAAADVIVGFRDGRWDGWMCREWKSGVKVVNAMAARRPFLSQPCAAVRELRPVGVTIEHASDLEAAFDQCASKAVRIQADCQDRPELRLEAVAAMYRGMLETAVRAKAA